MIESKGNRVLASIIFKVLSILTALSLCIIPVLGSQTVQAAPPPGSSAASTFTSATTPPPAASTATTTTTTVTETEEPTVTTDKINYEHGDTAAISGSGFIAGSDVTVTVTTPEGETTSWTVQADSTGTVSTNYTFGDGADGYFSAVLSDGTSSATTVFADPVATATLRPNQDIDSDLSSRIWVDAYWKNGWIYVPAHWENPSVYNYTMVDDTSSDGDYTEVYNYAGGLETDIYGFTDLPSGFVLVEPDTLAPNTPTPTSTTHTTGAWSNNPNITMVWNSVTDQGGATANPTVQIVTVAKAPGLFNNLGLLEFAVNNPTTGSTTYTSPIYLTRNYNTYTYTMSTDPNGNAWTTATINNLQAGIALHNLGSTNGAQATQVYAVVTSGSQGATGVKGYNYSWNGTTYTLIPGTTVTSNLADGSYTFNVNAEDNNGNKSANGTSGTYLIDTKGPAVTTVIDGGTTPTTHGWYNKAAVGSDNQLGVTVNANDTNGTTPVSGVAYIVHQVGSNPSITDTNTSTAGAIGNGKSATQSTTYVISTLGNINQGTTTLTNSATDVANNTTSTTQTVLIDTVGPSVSNSYSGTVGNNNWYKSSVTATASASDATSGVDTVTSTLNGTSITSSNPNTVDSNHKSGSYSTATTISNQGMNTFNSSATDYAGNTSATTLTDTIKIDSAGPTIAHTGVTGTAGNNGWYKSAITVTSTATDATSGVDSITNNLDGSSTTSTNPTWTDTTNLIKSSPYTTGTSVTGEGLHTLSSSSQDVAGNTSGTVTDTYKIDSVGPTVTNTYSGTLGNNGWYTSNVDATINASDATSGVNSSALYALGASVDGSNTWTRYSVETNPTWTDSTNQIKSSPFNRTVNNVNVGADGITSVTSGAADVAGNMYTTATDTIKTDKTGPTIAHTSITGTAGNNGWYTSAVNVTSTATDATSGVDSIQNNLNGTTTTTTNTNVVDATNIIKSGTFATNTNITGEGSNTLTSSSTDVAGNNSGTATNTILIDTQGPTLATNLSGTTGENGWYTSTVGVSLNASDPTPGSGIDTIQYSVNGASTTATNTDTTGAIANGKSSTFSTNTNITTEGVTSLTSSTSDVAGNSSATNTDTVKIDTVDPTLVKTINGAAPIDSTTHNGWYNAADLASGGGTLNIALTSTDATSGVQNITYSVNGASTTSNGGGANTYTANLALDSTNQGTNTLTHSAKDMAGNAYVLTTQTVKLDSIIPTIVSSVARTGLDQVTVTLTGADAISGSGIDNIAYSTDGSTQVTVIGTGYDQTVTYVVTGYGSHALAQSIADIAGNQAGQNSSVAIGQSSNASGLPNSPVPTLTFSLLNGTMNSIPVTTSGMLLSDADLTSPDGLLTLNIPAGTTARNSDGTPAYLNQDPDIISIAASNGNAPDGYEMISSYDLTPNGITFDSPITLGIRYGSNLPNGKQPVIAFYDEAASNWVDLETAGYIAADGSAVSNTAAARVSHFTRFALLAK